MSFSPSCRLTIRKAPNQLQGFTLIELVVVILIFSVITVLIFQSFDGLLRANQRSEENASSDLRLHKSWSILLADFIQIRARPVRDILGTKQRAYQTGLADYVVRFTRGGIAAHGNQEALQRIAYSVNEIGDLKRSVWLVLDSASQDKVRTQTLVSNVQTFRVEQLNLNGDFDSLWPPLNVSMPLDALPQMIQITLITKSGIRLQRILPGVMRLDSVTTDREARERRFPLFDDAELNADTQKTNASAGI